MCEKEFVDANALSDHERQVHTEQNETCKICGKLETNSYTLYGHMQNHETKICQVCNENLPKKNFARHWKSTMKLFIAAKFAISISPEKML